MIVGMNCLTKWYTNALLERTAGQWVKQSGLVFDDHR